jgi:hypothetical protein
LCFPDLGAQSLQFADPGSEAADFIGDDRKSRVGLREVLARRNHFALQIRHGPTVTRGNWSLETPKSNYIVWI